MLAWTLGDAIEVIQTSSYISRILQSGGLSADYIPAIVSLLGFVISFSTGSAFGSMGILFPLIIPIVAKLTDCDSDASLQSSAAVLGSSIFGNVLSPIADLTILTTAATQCPLRSHIKTACVYTLLVGGLSIVVGTLPVGAGWYPWYAAWIIMLFMLVANFLVFSANGGMESSRSLCNIICPCAFSIPAKLLYKLRSSFKCCTKDETTNSESDENSRLLPNTP